VVHLKNNRNGFDFRLIFTPEDQLHSCSEMLRSMITTKYHI
jgi:hypothetical protein